MQAGLSKTPMHLAAVYIYIYIRMVFRHLCGGRQEHLWGEPPPRTFFFGFVASQWNYDTQKANVSWRGFVHIVIDVMSQHCHQDHNIVIDGVRGGGKSSAQHCHRYHNIVIDVTSLSSTSQHCYRHRTSTSVSDVIST